MHRLHPLDHSCSAPLAWLFDTLLKQDSPSFRNKKIVSSWLMEDSRRLRAARVHDLFHVFRGGNMEVKRGILREDVVPDVALAFRLRCL